MKNMDKALTVPKWVLINHSKIPQVPKCPKMYLHKLSAQAQKFGISMKKRLHWASVVRGNRAILVKNTYMCIIISSILSCLGLSNLVNGVFVVVSNIIHHRPVGICGSKGSLAFPHSGKKSKELGT